MATTKDYYLDISMADEERLLAAKTILGYEAGVRGMTLGQTLCSLVRDAVDVDSYPEEMRSQLAEIREAAQRRAVQRAIEAGSLPKSA